MPIPAVVSSLSTEYVDVPVKTNLDLTGATAEAAFTAAANVEPADPAWIPAEVVETVALAGDPDGFEFGSKVRVLIGPLAGEVLAEAVHHEWVRIQAVGSPERPVLYAGTVTIT